MAEKTKPIIVGIAGGSAAGKTTLANAVARRCSGFRPAIIQYDSYYRDRSDLSFREREKINYDHPDALESGLLVRHLKELRAGRKVEIPAYDFTTHTRKKRGMIISPAPLLIVEGNLLFVHPELRRQFDLRVFVDGDADVRFIRRLQRDVKERGRSAASVISQYLKTVRPMHQRFVEPGRKHAHVIFSDRDLSVAAGKIVSRLRRKISAGRTGRRRGK